MQPIKIGIVGLGNIGRVLGVSLSASGYFVEAVTGKSPRNVRKDNYSSYELSGDFGNKSYLVRIMDDAQKLSNDLDVIFICTKNYDGEKLLPIVRNKIKANGAVVTIQNTFWVDRVAKYVGGRNSVCMLVDFACETVDGITYVHNFDGIKLGIYNKEAYDILHTVHDLLVNICKVKDTNDIIGMSLGRNVINLAISSLGAISGLSLKGILNDRNGRYLFIKMIEEEVYLFNHFGMKIMPYDNKLDYYAFVEQSFKGKVTRYKILKLLKKNNGNVHSSALRDLENGKKCEIFGVIESFLRHVKHHGLEAPYISEIFAMLKEIEKGERRIYENSFYEKRLIEIERRNKK